MTETRFWWVRHAPVVDNGGLAYGGGEIDADVSDRATFQGLAAALPRDAAFVASGLARTRQTLAAVRAEGRHDIPETPEMDVRLNEQHLGDWQGQPIIKLFPDGWPWPGHWMVDADTRPPGGETFHEVYARVDAALQDLCAAHAGRDVVVAAHGGTIRAALGHALGLPAGRALSFRVENCSITRIDHIRGDGAHAWRVGGTNQPPK